jgi:hypothetical protein
MIFFSTIYVNNLFTKIYTQGHTSCSSEVSGKERFEDAVFECIGYVRDRIRDFKNIVAVNNSVLGLCFCPAKP